MTDLRLLLATDAVGGVWTYSIELARALRPLGVTTTLAVMGPSPDEQQRRELAGIDYIDTGLALDWTAANPGELRAAGNRLVELANHQSADIVQLCSAALAADVRFRQPVVAVQHSCVSTWWHCVRGGALPSDFFWRRDLVECGLNAADAIVAPTAAFAALTAREYDLCRPVYAVHNGRTPIPLARRSRADFVLTVGRLWDEAKNAETLDRAAKALSVPIEAVGALSGPNGESASFEHLRTVGSLPPQAIAERLSARPIFASAALYEPFGLAALEAAQAGCALILSDIPTLRELWGEAALFVDPNDAAGFGEAIESLIADSGRRDGLGRAAQLRALQFTPAAMARRMMQIYRPLAGRTAPANESLQLLGAA